MSDPESVYQSLFDRLPIGMFRITETGEVKRANLAFVRMLSLPNRSMVIGRSLGWFFNTGSDFDLLLAEIDRSGEVEDFEVLLRTRDNELIWGRINARRVGSGPDARSIEGALENISHLKQAHRAQRESDHFARTVMDSVAEGIFGYDRRLQITFWNAFMTDLTGKQPEEVIGRPANAVFPVLDRLLGPRGLGQVLAGEPVLIEAFSYSSPAGGKEGWYSLQLSAHRSVDEEIIGVVATVHEITERKQAEEERERLLAAERGQRLRAEALGRVSRALNAVLDLPALLELICKESSELFEVDAALVWLVDRAQDQGDYLENIAGYGWEHERFAGMQINLDDMNNLATRVIRERIPISLNDLSETTRTGLSGIFKVRAIMAVPLFQGIDVIGVLQIIDIHGINRFGDTEIEIALELANHAANAVHNAQLYDWLQDAHSELESAYVSTLEGWARALELHDAYTEGHSSRVTEMTLRLAKAVGIPETELEHIRRGALLHDIGKMGVPANILAKPGPLSEEEWAVMRRHPVYAFSMLSPINHLRPAIDIPYCHHERWDGEGYPRGLSGDEIPLAARIFTIVDVYDALTSDRPYREAWPPGDATRYIREEAGRLFDPGVVDIFMNLLGGS
jgi:PAS domain S-box-containing protein